MSPLCVSLDVLQLLRWNSSCHSSHPVLECKNWLYRLKYTSASLQMVMIREA